MIKRENAEAEGGTNVFSELWSWTFGGHKVVTGRQGRQYPPFELPSINIGADVVMGFSSWPSSSRDFQKDLHVGSACPPLHPPAQRSDTRGLKGNIAHLGMTLLIASLIEFSDAWGLRPDSKDISIYHVYWGYWKHMISLKAHIHVFFQDSLQFILY